IASTENHWDEAERFYRRALELDPCYEEAHNNLAAVISGTDPDAAVKHLRRAIEIDPEYVDAHENLGVILSEQGDSSGAEYHLERAHTLRIRTGEDLRDA
ncbi:MAG: tetratricopeptide repeat protein, partial [bacterium]|nr:tetratricopeptide repeat protein [bacterium]